MTELVRTEAERIITFVLGELANWQRPQSLESVGSRYPELFDAFEQDLNEILEQLRSVLTQRYTASELEAEFPDSEARNPLLQVAGPFGALARRIARAKSRAPQDFVGGWSVRGREIDLGHWRAIPAYSIVELTLLSIGRDPRHTSLEALFATYGRSEQADEMLYFLEDRQEQFARAFGQAPDDLGVKIGATEVLKWVKKKRVRIDDRFRRMLAENWPSKPETKQSAFRKVAIPDPAPHGSSKKAYARLITAVAMGKYGLREQSKIGNIARQMSTTTELEGLYVDVKLVRDMLRLGWRLLTDQNRSD